MEQKANEIRFHSLVILFAVCVIAISVIILKPSFSSFTQLAALKPPSQPLFSSLDSFVLFAEKEITLEQETQISSGDLGSNNKLDIQKDTIVNGNLFAKEITIDKNTQINGNASFNKLKLHKESQVLGATTTPISLPIANLPQIPSFPIGAQDFTFQGTLTSNILSSGNYRNIILEKNSRLILTGGTYNLRKLELKENSILIYNSSTTINIQFKLKGQNHTSILPGNNNLSATDLFIKYLGIKPENDKEKEDDDIEIESIMDAQDKKDFKSGKVGRPIIFGKDSFLNFKLLASKANVKIGEQTTFRGQIFGRKIRVGKSSVLSREDFLFKTVTSADIVTDPDGGVYPINTVLVSLTSTSTFDNALQVASVVGGKIVGLVASINLYQIEMPAKTITELEVVINSLRTRADLGVDGVFRDFLLPIDI